MTETMLIRGMNGGERSIRETAQFIAALRPQAAYLSVTNRPPSCPRVRPPNHATLEAAAGLFGRHITDVRRLFDGEDAAFAPSGNAERDLLSIAAVHPLRFEAVARLLEEDHADWSVVEALMDQGKLFTVTYEG